MGGGTVISTQLGTGALSGTFPGGNTTLLDNQLYAVQVYAVDTAGLAGPCSEVAYGTPYQIEDFWLGYKADGGQATGCTQAAGPGALLAALAVMLGVGTRRRRERR